MTCADRAYRNVPVNRPLRLSWVSRVLYRLHVWLYANGQKVVFLNFSLPRDGRQTVHEGTEVGSLNVQSFITEVIRLNCRLEQTVQHSCSRTIDS